MLLSFAQAPLDSFQFLGFARTRAHTHTHVRARELLWCAANRWQHAPWHAPCHACLFPCHCHCHCRRLAARLPPGPALPPAGGGGVMKKCSELLLAPTKSVCAPLPDPFKLNFNALRTQQPTYYAQNIITICRTAPFAALIMHAEPACSALGTALHIVIGVVRLVHCRVSWARGSRWVPCLVHCRVAAGRVALLLLLLVLCCSGRAAGARQACQDDKQ